MAEITLAEVSSDFSKKFLVDLIERLDEAYPDHHPRVKIDDYQQGFRAGALEVIRLLKEEVNGT